MSTPSSPADWRREREVELTELIAKYSSEVDVTSVTTAAQLVDRICRARMRKTYENYSVVFRRLLASDEQLKTAYAR